MHVLVLLSCEQPILTLKAKYLKALNYQRGTKINYLPPMRTTHTPRLLET